MEIRLEEHTIREIFDGYKDSADNGVIAFGGKLKETLNKSAVEKANR